MVQVFQDQPSFASRLSGTNINALGEFAKTFGEEKLAQRQQKKLTEASDLENAQIRNNYGIDLSGISDPKTRQMILSEQLKGQNAKKGHDLGGASNSLNKMESLIDKKGIGFLEYSMNPSSEARQNRGEFEALQAAILPIFKSMFPRGMTEKEFKYINEHYMPQVNDTRAKMKGKIQGLKQLIQEHGTDFNMNQEQGQSISMRDSKGNIYDIPAHLYEQARAKGLM